ncbi:hypothetical protein [Aquipseudomonas guryensis]|jgi:uncharacterized membrane protein|uniref:DUF4870 domain-containing protein n=1 Tax=Aquipseudomonas guryensis TaxID=2759165 RepID=A0A7W4DE49_9GAMM|nr:hypothetical protein [Pseudomonas guryensis]MBB1520951.1 hypothetical protein [Pseudomonas guryensis]
MQQDTDRWVAVATPVVLLALSVLLKTWATWFLPAALYFLYRRGGWAQARETALRLADLHLSLLVLAIPLGLLLGALGIVANDAGISRLPIVAVSGLLISALGIYVLVSYLFFSVKAYRGQLHSAKLNMGIIETLRGKRASCPQDSGAAS